VQTHLARLFESPRSSPFTVRIDVCHARNELVVTVIDSHGELRVTSKADQCAGLLCVLKATLDALASTENELRLATERIAELEEERASLYPRRTSP
jgi:hypothetical protein